AKVDVAAHVPDQAQTERHPVRVTQLGQLAADPRQHLQGSGRPHLELELDGNEQLLLVEVSVRQHHAHLWIEEQGDRVGEVELAGQTDGPHDPGGFGDEEQEQRRVKRQMEIAEEEPVHEIEADVVVDLGATVRGAGQAKTKAGTRLPAHRPGVQEADLNGVRNRIKQ